MRGFTFLFRLVLWNHCHLDLDRVMLIQMSKLLAVELCDFKKTIRFFFTDYQFLYF